MRCFRHQVVPALERPFAALLAALAVLAAGLLPLAHGLELRSACMGGGWHAFHEHRHDADSASHHHHADADHHHHDSAPEPGQDDEHDPATCPTCAVILAINAATSPVIDDGATARNDNRTGVARRQWEPDAASMTLDGRLPARGPPAPLA